MTSNESTYKSSQLLESVRLSLLTCGMAVSWDWVLGMLTKVRSVKHEITPTAVQCIPSKFCFRQRENSCQTKSALFNCSDTQFSGESYDSGDFGEPGEPRQGVTFEFFSLAFSLKKLDHCFCFFKYLF